MSQSIANEIQIESRERRPLRLDDILKIGRAHV